MLCFVASWSDARLMHLELARSDCIASRLCLRGYLLGRLPPRCSQQACWSVLVFPPSGPVIAGGAVFCQQQLMFFVSRRADASPVMSLDYPGRKQRAVRVLWVSRVLKLVRLSCLLERVRIPAPFFAVTE